MTEFNSQQQQLREAIKDELSASGGSSLTSELRDALYPQHAAADTDKRSFHRHLLRMCEKMKDAGDIRTEDEHTNSSRPELRWIKK